MAAVIFFLFFRIRPPTWEPMRRPAPYQCNTNFTVLCHPTSER